MKPALIIMVTLSLLCFLFFCNSNPPQPEPTDRIVWTKYGANPVFKKSNPFTETYAVGQPSCLFENDTFKMWYETQAGFCLATSTGEVIKQ
jgi:hypothetical protein